MVLKNAAKKTLSLLLFSFCLAEVFSLEVPALKGRVNDYANLINKNDEKELVEYLEALDEQTGIQIVVLTVQSLKGEDIASYGVKVAEKWGIGHSQKDDGALLLVALEEHDIRIEVGYGLEDSLTDAKCGLIIRNVIIPEFKDGDFSTGIVKGAKNMGGIASGNTEIVAKSVLEEDEDDPVAGLIFMILWLIFIFVVIGSKGGIWKWIFLSRISNSFGNSVGKHSGGRSSSSFGGFGGGSSFGGGFSGGGGHFGGGGASGHW